MGRFFIIILFYLPFVLSAQRTDSILRVPDVVELNSYIEKAFNNWKVPGLALGIIYKDSVIMAKGYGTLSVTDKNPVDANTIFGIASNTKSFTAAAIAILVDQKIISLDDRVVKYVPYFRLYNDYVTQEMTIRDLLCHRSGLKTFSGDLIWYGSEHSRKEIIERAAFLQPAHGFRAKYGYSNIMYLVAGQLIFEVTGMTWEDFVEQKLMKPAGMNNSCMSVRFLKDKENVAYPHARVKGEYVQIPYINWDNIAPAGAVNSSVNDMLKWLRLQLNRGSWNDSQIWSDKMAREMWLPHTIDNVSAFSEKLHPTKHFSCYGLGWDLFDFYGYKIVNHAGGLDGMVSQTFMIPELDFGCVILTNSATTLPYALMHQILEFVIGNPSANDWCDSYLSFYNGYEQFLLEKEKEKERKRNKDAQPSFPLKVYSGLYSGNVYGNVKIELKQDRLYLRMMHSPSFHAVLNHWEGDTFSVKFEEHPSLPRGEVRFLTDENKTRVISMEIEVPNPDFDFTELDLNKIK